MDDERASKEEFGEADLGEAQAENPPEDPEMIEGATAREPGRGDAPPTGDVAATPPRKDLQAEEEAQIAAREAGRIGGATASEDLDPEQQAPSESGGGEAEGFELAEEQLEESASHGDTAGDPLEERLPPEDENPEDHTIYGEPDEVDSTASGEDTRGTDARDPETP